MKIAVAQLNVHIGNFEGNLAKMLSSINDARDQGADLICFSELCTCGYPPRDFLEFSDFIDLSNSVIDRLKEASTDIAVVVGAPRKNPTIEGKDLFNSAFVLYEGKIQHIADKALLPTYDIFDEYRYFEPASTFKTVNIKGVRFAVTVCEDIWNIGNENPLYTTCPMDEMVEESPDCILNLSASPFSYNHAATRIEVLKANVARYGLPMFYVNHIGAQTEVVFDGGSLVMSPDGSVHDELPYFEECLRCYELDEVIKNQVERPQPKEKIDLIHRALVLGVKDYFGKLGFKKAILGLSGGIDSAVTAAIAAEALGGENVLGLLMPSEFSSDHSVNDAVELAENLKMPHKIIPIGSIFGQFTNSLESHFKDLPFDVTEENIQARIRGMLLMSFSNKFGNILLNTSNKSEMAVGYGTLYGDLCGGMSVIGDLYKMEVYALAEDMNKAGIRVPLNTIAKAPSAELRHDQKDSDSLPPYPLLDEILFQYIEGQLGPNEIIENGHDRALVERILKMVNRNEFKRYQTAPVLRVSTKAFGMGRRMPIVGKYLS